jgi:hypothetical protein
MSLLLVGMEPGGRYQAWIFLWYLEITSFICDMNLHQISIYITLGFSFDAKKIFCLSLNFFPNKWQTNNLKLFKKYIFQLHSYNKASFLLFNLFLK